MAVYNPGKGGTIRTSADYNVAEACVKLHDAMKGIGTDEEAIIDVVASHTNQDLQRIKKKYRMRYGKDLIKELDSELSFNFGKLVLALMTDSEDFVLECIHKVINSRQTGPGGKLYKRFSSFFKEGLSGHEYLLIGLLCTRSNADLKEIKRAYKKKYGDRLEQTIAIDGNNMPHDVCSFVLDMITEEREDEDAPEDMDKLEQDCLDLSTAEDEDVLHTLLTERSFKHLKHVFEECLNLGGRPINGIIDDLEGDVSVEMQEAYRAVVNLITDGEPTFYAERVKATIDGTGTDNDTLIRILVLRAEVDLVQIMQVYEEKFKSDMAAEIADDTSGDYRDLLMRIMTVPPPLPPSPPPPPPGEQEDPVGAEALEQVVEREEEETLEVEIGARQEAEEEKDGVGGGDLEEKATSDKEEQEE